MALSTCCRRDSKWKQRAKQQAFSIWQTCISSWSSILGTMIPVQPTATACQCQGANKGSTWLAVSRNAKLATWLKAVQKWQHSFTANFGNNKPNAKLHGSAFHWYFFYQYMFSFTFISWYSHPLLQTGIYGLFQSQPISSHDLWSQSREWAKPIVVNAVHSMAQQKGRGSIGGGGSINLAISVNLQLGHCHWKLCFAMQKMLPNQR